MIKKFKGIRYDIPDDLIERFDYWTEKITKAKRENHDELYHGSLIAFKTEFRKYKK